MKNVLIQCLHRPGRSPSQRFRFEQYLDYLSQNGYNFTFSYLLNDKADKEFYSAGNMTGKLRIVVKSAWKRLKELQTTSEYDLVFVQREGFMLGTAFFEKAMGKKVPLIFDFDDSIWLQTISEANRKLAFLKDASKTSKIIEASSLVFAGNEFLANYAQQFNRSVKIVPTTIDTELYQKVSRPLENSICIGWSGSFSTVDHFKTALPALTKIKEKYAGKVKFKIIGDGNYYCEELGTQALPWVASTEVEDLNKFDIGIMPLPDTEWAKGKCGLKGLQYMALGIPTLMSPVGVNTQIIQNGANGFLPGNDQEWVQYLSALIDDIDLRRRIGEAGRETVIQNYSFSTWKSKYLECFNNLVLEKNFNEETRTGLF